MQFDWNFTKNYCIFCICGWIFCLNKHFLTIYMDDRYFFQYGQVQFDTHISPQVPVFDIIREPVLALNQWDTMFDLIKYM